MSREESASEAARLLGQIGGRSRSRRKQESARENGKRGGRPVGVKESRPRRKLNSRQSVTPVRELVLDQDFGQE